MVSVKTKDQFIGKFIAESVFLSILSSISFLHLKLKSKFQKGQWIKSKWSAKTLPVNVINIWPHSVGVKEIFWTFFQDMIYALTSYPNCDVPQDTLKQMLDNMLNEESWVSNSFSEKVFRNKNHFSVLRSKNTALFQWARTCTVTG